MDTNVTHIAVLSSSQASADASLLCRSLPFLGFEACFGVWDDDGQPPGVESFERAACAVLVGSPLPVVGGRSLATALASQGLGVVWVPYASRVDEPELAAWVEAVAARPPVAPPREPIALAGTEPRSVAAAIRSAVGRLAAAA